MVSVKSVGSWLAVFVFFFSAGACASDFLKSFGFPFSPWILSCFPVVFLLYRVLSLLVLVVFLIFLLLIFLLLCVLILITYVILIFLPFFFFFFFLLLCVYLAWFLLLLWFLSLFLLFLIVCFFFFFPPPPRALQKKKTMEKNMYLILLVSGGSLRKCPFTKSLYLSFFGGFPLSTEHVFVWCYWNVSWGSKRLFVASSLLLCFCFGVWKRTFFRSNLSLVLAWVHCLLCSCSSDFLLCFCLWGVFVGSGLFLFNSVRHLGIVFPSLLCPNVASSTSCLGCSFVCGGFWACLFARGGGRLGMANRKGSMYFSVFLISGVFGWKQALSPRARVFAHVFCFKSVHLRKRSKQTTEHLLRETLQK